MLALWDKAPTPAQAARLTEKTVASVLAAHRIRRVTAAEALAFLKRPALTVAPGTTEAAKAHIAMITKRLRLVNRQIKDVSRHIEILLGQLAEPWSEPGQEDEPSDAAILRSMPGVGTIVVATLLAEAPQAVRERNH